MYTCIENPSFSVTSVCIKLWNRGFSPLHKYGKLQGLKPLFQSKLRLTNQTLQN
jgi:hypothetical protein